MTRPILALDCDGVLLDYSLAYARAWERAFGEFPRERDPDAYWPMDRWEVRRVVGEELERFRAAFDETFFSTIPPLPGAVEACHQLADAGYELVCVTALPERFADARVRNLRDEGFPISRVIATGHEELEISPKAKALHELQPVAFVDDFIQYMIGVDRSIHQALIMRGRTGSPNEGPQLELAHSLHPDLPAFARWWLARE
ncbi:MAG TPA: HAD family hydrolase [Burkholderiaceae bacterium]|nr:HAD family hydrolase [Burkholderiaceae bacterium]